MHVVPHNVPSCRTQYICVFCIIYNPPCHALLCCMLNSGALLVMDLQQDWTSPFGLSFVSVVDYTSPKHNYFGTLVLALAHELHSIYLAWPRCFSASYLVHPAFFPALRLSIIFTWFMDFSTLSAVSSSRALSTLSRESNVSFNWVDPRLSPPIPLFLAFPPLGLFEFV